MLRRVALIALMMEEASTSETSVNFYQTTLFNIPEDSHLHPQFMIFHQNGTKFHTHTKQQVTMHTFAKFPSLRYVLPLSCIFHTVTLFVLITKQIPVCLFV
jgi:hypothetical protein